MKTGVIDVGGGLRGIYGAGIMDYCMDQGIHFDCCITTHLKEDGI